jgi:hypothetical protein
VDALVGITVNWRPCQALSNHRLMRDTANPPVQNLGWIIPEGAVSLSCPEDVKPGCMWSPLSCAEIRSNVKTSWKLLLYFLSVTHRTTQAVAVTRGAQIPGDYVLFKVGTNICVPPIRNFLHVTRLTPRILRWLLHVWNVFTPLAQTVKIHHPILRWLMNSNYDCRRKVAVAYFTVLSRYTPAPRPSTSRYKSPRWQIENKGDFLSAAGHQKVTKFNLLAP